MAQEIFGELDQCGHQQLQDYCEWGSLLWLASHQGKEVLLLVAVWHELRHCR